MVTRVLITGHDGYLGSVMTPLMVRMGYEVVGLDTGYYAGCTLAASEAKVRTVRKDIRDLEASDLAEFDAVIHLAALSNDPVGNLNPSWTQEINVQASLRLAELAKAARVQRFLFASSCIMYGMSEAAVVTEESPVDPKTEYARSKVSGERAISALAEEEFSPTFLRNGTIYGFSPCMRFDTVVNNLVGSAMTMGRIVLSSDGKPWRPVAHIQDVARAFLQILEAPRHLIHNQVFNNGDNSMNHQVIEVAEVVAQQFPGCELVCGGSPDADQRTYRTDFGKFARTFPAFRFTRTLEQGVQELCEALRAVRLTREDFISHRFTRVRWLRHLVETGRVEHSLRWADHRGPAP